MIVSTLAMIETPGAFAFQIDSPKSDDVDAPLLDEKTPDSIEDVQSEVLLVKAKPITAKIFRTMKHLRTQAGPWARFRGLHIAIIYSFVRHLLVSSLSHTFLYDQMFLATVVSAVILCRLQMTWAHVVMSLPSKKPWYRRMPTFKNTKNIVVPTILLAVAQEAAIFVPRTISEVVGLDLHDPLRDMYEDLGSQKIVLLEVLLKLLLIFVAGLFTNLLVIVPARVTLTRVEASLLPEENETIVPFDRSFGGKVEPEILGGSGSVSMLEAWKSFDWSARFRLVKLFAKIALVELTTTLAFAVIGGVELWLLMRNKNIKL